MSDNDNLKKFFLKPTSESRAIVKDKVITITLSYDLMENTLEGKSKFINNKIFTKSYKTDLEDENICSLEDVSAEFSIDNKNTGFINLTIKVYDEDYNKLIWRQIIDYDMFKEYCLLFECEAGFGYWVVSSQEE